LKKATSAAGALEYRWRTRWLNREINAFFLAAPSALARLHKRFLGLRFASARALNLIAPSALKNS